MKATAPGDLRAMLDRQRAAFLKDGPPSAEIRIDRIDRCIALLVDNQEEIADALNTDFGNRSPQMSKFTDIAGSIGPLKHAKENLRKWMRIEKRKTTPAILGWFGAKAEIHYQPLGVVGIIAPWNFPVNLTFAPLAGVLSAGNRAMIKPSEFTPATSDLMARMFAKSFAETEIAVCIGGPQVGDAFSKLPFDHLLFTGATSIAYHVMRAAAENLTPVTLELGGKSPVIIGQGANLEQSATRVMTGKTLNAGQICLAPDYVLVSEGQRDEFVSHAKAAVTRMYPTLKDNPDYTSVVNQRHFDRLQGYIDEAKSKGAKVVEINPAKEDLRQQPYYKIAPTIILDPTDDMKVMQDEIFGPILPVKTYKTMDEAIGYVNAKARPLGLYYFGGDAAEQDRVLTRTTSGGVTVNDTIMHIAMEDLPFGGVGPSGMGAYHGIDGFRQFSHRKAVYQQPTSNFIDKQLAGIRAPYGDAMQKQLAGSIKR
ncbi:MAG: coniferyl aldehyde dehydrogenase [Alphaproteobacteria bacterium]|nr:coniferyl aldehyde dehydrogenase [Alphaproteobacteria bacterium]